MFWVGLPASSRQMMDGSTVVQQLEAVAAAVCLFLLRRQLRSLFQHGEPDSKHFSCENCSGGVNAIKKKMKRAGRACRGNCG